MSFSPRAFRLGLGIAATPRIGSPGLLSSPTRDSLFFLWSPSVPCAIPARVTGHEEVLAIPPRVTEEPSQVSPKGASLHLAWPTWECGVQRVKGRRLGNLMLRMSPGMFHIPIPFQVFAGRGRWSPPLRRETSPRDSLIDSFHDQARIPPPAPRRTVSPKPAALDSTSFAFLW